MDSILTSIKKLLGIEESYAQFDADIIMHINSTLFTLAQLGVGKKGFIVTTDEATWSDFLGRKDNLEAVKSYVYYKVRLAFDPPTNSFVLEAMVKMANEYEWRLMIEAESEEV